MQETMVFLAILGAAMVVIWLVRFFRMYRWVRRIVRGSRMGPRRVRRG